LNISLKAWTLAPSDFNLVGPSTKKPPWFANRFADDEDEMEVRNWLRQTTVKRLLHCGFQQAGKAMQGSHQCSCKICQEIYVFPRFKYHMPKFFYPFVTYLLTLPHMSKSTLRIPNNYIYRWILDNRLYKVGNNYMPR
jgi:hypothetical protein